MSSPYPSSPMGMGGGMVDQGAAQQVNIAEEIRAVMRQIRELGGQLDAIAGTFPVASEALEAAKVQMTAAVKAIIANSSTTEPTATRTLA